MLQHLLVPLDGTRLAETALPAATALASLLQARITLLHLVEKDAAPAVHGERHLTEAGEAEDYLEQLRLSLLQSAPNIDIHVHAPAVSDVAGGIAAHREELHPDLIVMCTHGRGGLGRLLRGSLAQQVLTLGSVPLLLVNPDAARNRPLALQRLLVPLDGAPQHEAGLRLASQLAAAAGGRLQLLSVVAATPALAGRAATLSRFMPGTTQALQQLTSTGLKDYLDGRLLELAAAGLADRGEVGYGKVDEVIVSTAESWQADLIVLATHGKAGTRAFWANSMAARVQSRSRLPLLLVPVTVD